MCIVYSEIEQISNYVEDKETQVSHCQQEVTHKGKKGGWDKPCGVWLESEVLVWSHGS